MKIPFTNTYQTRDEMFIEKIYNYYKSTRMLVSRATRGIFPYTTFQPHYFFLQRKQIDDYKDLFLDVTSIEEIISHDNKLRLFNDMKTKYYLFNLFERALFLQQFFQRYRL